MSPYIEIPPKVVQSIPLEKSPRENPPVKRKGKKIGNDQAVLVPADGD